MRDLKIRQTQPTKQQASCGTQSDLLEQQKRN